MKQKNDSQQKLALQCKLVKCKECKESYIQLLKKSTRSQKQAQRLSRRLITEHEEDRKKISRELHDHVAQMMTGINYELAILAKITSNSSQSIRSKVLNTRQLIDNSIEQIHNFARQLRPATLDLLGLIPTVRSYANEFSKKTTLPVKLTIQKHLPRLSDIKKTVLFRIIQEALTNISKHAHATQVSITIRKARGDVFVLIKDNGKSFNLNQLRSLNRNKGLGLIGMEERLKMIHGSLSIKSFPQRGTLIQAQVPINEKKKAI